MPQHHIVRSSWVIGDGNNLVRTMASLAERGVHPSVVDDQIGRLSFAEDIAAGIRNLLAVQAPFGVYNFSNSGGPMSWADTARAVFSLTGHDPARVTGVSTADYFAGKEAAPRPLNSMLDLSRIERAGFVRPQRQRGS